MAPRLNPFLLLLLTPMLLQGSCRCDQSGRVPADALLVTHCLDPIALDGRLDDPCWQRASFVGPLRQHDGRAPGRQSTRVAAIWDGKRLIFGFDCADLDIVSPYRKRDEPLYHSEVVEVFLDADGDRQDYVEFEVSPAGVGFDATFQGRRQGMDLSYDPPTELAVAVEGSLNHPGDRDTAWSVELAIPFSALWGRGRLPPEAGDCWRINLFRLDKSAGGGEAQAWRPTTGDFHDLDAFGPMCFLGP